MYHSENHGRNPDMIGQAFTALTTGIYFGKPMLGGLWCLILWPLCIFLLLL